MIQNNAFNHLQSREVFHLEFLRCFGRKVKPQHYVLKGGVNLRFFFHSCRYSEDMDLDISGVRVDVLKDIVMEILERRSLRETLKPFGIEKISPPDISKAKQTETTQRFKVHLLISSGEDLFTKIEFSRRGMKDAAVVGSVSDMILRAYKMPPLLVSHYEVQAAVMQKIHALVMRSAIQARDIFDLYVLGSQIEERELGLKEMNAVLFKKAREHIFKISFGRFKDTVVSYLSPEDQVVYGTVDSWDEIKLKAAHFIEELENGHA